MGGVSRREAAERAGASIELVEQLVELGVVRPGGDDQFTSGDVRKIGLIKDLMAGGLPLDALAAEIGTGRIALDFLDNPAFDMFSTYSNQTFEELSKATEIPVETLLVIPEAIGAGIHGPTDRVRENELDIVPMIKAQLLSGYSLAAVEHGLRTMGDSLRRLAVADADAFRRSVIDPVAQRPGLQGSDIGAAAAAATQRIAPTTDQAMLAIYHAQQGTRGRRA